MQRRPGLDLDDLGASIFQVRPLMRCEWYGGHQDEAAQRHIVEPSAVGQKGVGAEGSGQ